MIIECGHCGAPLDVKAEARVSKCAYCGMSNQVQSQRTLAFETPPGWQPPPKWVPPEHLALAHQELTYRAARSVAPFVVLVVVLGVLGAVGAVVASVVTSVTSTVQQVSNVEREVDRATQQANDAIAQALAQASAARAGADDALGRIPGAKPGAPQLSLLTNPGVQQALDVYKRALGVQTLSAMELTFHESHSSASLQSPKNPSHIDGYSYILGGVRGPEPKRLMDREKANLKSLLFDPEKTALRDLETLKRQAMGKLEYEEAKVTHVIVERDRGKVVIRIYASNARESGYVAFDEKGKVTRVAR